MVKLAIRIPPDTQDTHVDFESAFIELDAHEVLVAVAGVSDDLIVLGASGRRRRRRRGGLGRRRRRLGRGRSEEVADGSGAGAALGLGVEALLGGESVVDNLNVRMKCYLGVLMLMPF